MLHVVGHYFVIQVTRVVVFIYKWLYISSKKKGLCINNCPQSDVYIINCP